MDSVQLNELLQLLRQQNGGVVLQKDGKSEAVLLSIDRYYQLLEKQQDNQIQARDKALIKKLTVLVTGGAGYIGAHIVRQLLKKGHQVIVVDNFVTGKREFVPKEATLVEGSIGDRDVLDLAFSGRGVDVVMHLAASIEAPESCREPFSYFENNVIATHTLLQAMKEHSVPKIIFSSSASVYGDLVSVPTDENQKLQPDDPYGHTKLLGEKIIEFYTANSSLQATILRYFNVCGVDPNSELYDTHNESKIVPIILEVAYGKREKFIVYGNDFDTFDGTCIRDYIHVMDVVQAHILALENPGNEPLRIYNVGTGKGYSVEQMVSTAAEVLNRMIPLEIGPRRAKDVSTSIADNTKITKELGFKAEYSDLETIFKTSKI